MMAKTKKTFTLQNGNAYKAELFKSKNVKIIIRKRQDEGFIGDSKSKIKTNIASINRTSTVFKKFEDYKINEIDLKDESDDNDESDSDDDSVMSDGESFSVNGSEGKSSSNIIPSLSTPCPTSNIFNKYVNEEDPDASLRDNKNVENILRILERGYDENNNKITEKDVEYLDKYVPRVLKMFAKSKKSIQRRESQKRVYKMIDEIDSNNELNSQSNDFIYEMFSDSQKTAKERRSVYEIRKNELQLFRLKSIRNKVLREDEYFNPENKERLHVGRVMRIDEEIKRYKYTSKFWMSKENTFPINAKQLAPILKFAFSIFFDLVSKDETSTSFKKSMYNTFTEVLRREFQTDNRFPLKISKFNFFFFFFK